MNEQDFEKQVQEISLQLKQINKNTHSPLWRSFLTGTLSGLGSVVGVAIALTIIGLTLNAIGFIPAFKQQANAWHQTLDNLRQNK